MVKIETLRALVGEKKFDAAMQCAARNSSAEKAALKLSSMGAEPDNTGLSIEEGRAALKAASTRSYDLPHIGTLCGKE